MSSLRAEIIQSICDEKHRICGHIPPLHDGACNVCKMALFAECKIVEVFRSFASEAKPSDERPAREKMRQWAADERSGDEPHIALAIVESVDALTAAVREGRR